jgi:hypothetical protein
MSIAATSAFYLASIVWCCMPRSDPFCIAKGNHKGISKDDDDARGGTDDFYVTSPMNDTTTPNNETFETGGSSSPTQQHEDYGTPNAGASNNNAWADSDNRGGGPMIAPSMQEHHQSQQQSHHESQQPMFQPEWQTSSTHQSYNDGSQQYNDASAPPTGSSGTFHPRTAEHEDPPAYQDHTSSWTAHEISDPTPGYSPAAPSSSDQEPFANPFLIDEASAAQRPAYGNLQG